ncbi:MAG: PIG-L family deacetylase [Acidimicrobiia bacterium]|nr:PIG-L family deacetylase [Acidimicrobiia bacterium]
MSHPPVTTPRRALAIAAHPDDVEFNCGATLAKWAAAGCEVSHLICTDGSKGSWEPEGDLPALVALRQTEQRAAARALGATGEVVFLDWADGELEAGLEQRSQVAQWIRRLRPDIVLGHDPWKRYRLHPDHRAAGFLAVDGVVAARDPHFFPEHDVAHHRPSELWLFEADEPDHVEEVTGFGATKVAALEEHVSQFRTTMYIDPDDDGAQRAAFRDRTLSGLAECGEPAGFAQGEAFKRIEPL